jgi:hypothetical protein
MLKSPNLKIQMSMVEAETLMAQMFSTVTPPGKQSTLEQQILNCLRNAEYNQNCRFKTAVIDSLPS